MATGTTTIDFGTAPGSQYATIAVTGQTTIATDSHVEAWLMGEATASHNAYEHAMAPLRLTCGSIVAGTGFTIVGVCDWRVAGTFSVHWVWI